MNDILDGLAQIHLAFRRANLKSPTVILLESREEGIRFLSQINQKENWVAQVGSPDLGRFVEMADGSEWMECTVMEISVRWPANKVAMPDGSWSYA